MARVALSIAVVCCVVAGGISLKLLDKHLTGSSGSAWFEAGCTSDDSSGGANCAAVLASPYSYFPPKHPGKSAKGRIPVAFLGLAYYAVMGIWLIGVGRPGSNRPMIHVLPLLLVGAGLASSAFFTYVMFTRLNEWCPWCMATHVLNLVLAVCLVVLWPGRRRESVLASAVQAEAGVSADRSDTGSTSGAIALQMRRQHPTSRTLLVTCLAICFALFGLREMLGRASMVRALASTRLGYSQYKAFVDKIREDADWLLLTWQRAPEVSIAVNSDDPVRVLGTASAPVYDIVVFSDFECPSCKQLATSLETEIVPRLGGTVRITFKHYPLNSSCNPQTKTKKHAHACQGATLAEAARVLSGNDAFWKAHDYLFTHQEELAGGRLDVSDFAKQVGLDETALRETMSSEAVLKRIASNTNAGLAAGVNGTPVLFLNSRKVDTLARKSIAFWKKVGALDGGGP